MLAIITFTKYHFTFPYTFNPFQVSGGSNSAGSKEFNPLVWIYSRGLNPGEQIQPIDIQSRARNKGAHPRVVAQGLKRSRSTPTRCCSADHQWASCAAPHPATEVPCGQQLHLIKTIL
jgi:hypothetical protein